MIPIKNKKMKNLDIKMISIIFPIKKAQRQLAELLLVLIMSASYAFEEITYYHNDALGSPVAATDEAGNLKWREEYQPYGSRILKQDGGTNDTWFTGKQEDKSNGLSYFGARWYDPVLGRFTGIDPVDFKEGNIHSHNRYAYANNNPYLFVDPDGRQPFKNFKRMMNKQSLLDAGYGPGLSVGGRPASGRGYDNRSAAKINKENENAAISNYKPGAAGGPGAGKPFSKKTKDQAREESNNTCVFCGTKTTNKPGPSRSEIDHSIPKSRNGNNSSENAQNTCRTCNRQKGAKTSQEFIKK